MSAFVLSLRICRTFNLNSLKFAYRPHLLTDFLLLNGEHDWSDAPVEKDKQQQQLKFSLAILYREKVDF